MARDDVNMILNEGGFEVFITLESPSAVIAEIKGLAVTRNNLIESDFQVVNSKLAHVSFAEKDLLDLGYPVNNDDGKPFLKNHKVTYPNSNGDMITYVVVETMPSRTFGIISCLLGEYKAPTS